MLTSVGAMVGRGAFVRVGSQPHYPILFSLVIGRSGTGKGVSLDAVRPVLLAGDDPDEPFFSSRVRKGFQSGEALVQAAADLAPHQGAHGAGTDPGGLDQRMLVVESEFAKVVTIAQRQGSIYSTVLRSAWDGESLECRTRREKLVASAAHVGVIGHVTPADLHGKIDMVEIGNGFLNRFLLAWSAPTKLMATPRVLEEAVVAGFGARLRGAVEFGRSVGELTRTAAFDDAWASLYYVLRLRPTGGHVLDSLTARAAPHILRLAMVFALLDESPSLDVPHLRAAAALWEYCEASAAHVWGGTLGNSRLDALFDALVAAGDKGLTRSELNAVFSNNLPRGALDAMVLELTERGLAQAKTVPTGGRPREVLTATSR
ncbi:DUF3987 domain-containing protein [Nostocoides sp. HKS02]|uniref:DUF3987 domain-containing protein n=1 Tax=Nostocoides sp. HKS02 TaxID=1813880 RepID=UPI0012B4F5BB|nr:DUF3987 domain-containing protein [Tetrasphaera sp. HKS02]QGN58080.1 DUF3987 domain-containing protein [Tetrasphaera sp. HKS02]